MFGRILSGIFGSKNQRELKRIGKLVERINALEPEIQTLSDEQLTAKTAEFKERVAAGESLDSLLSEAFAVVREASKRVMGMRHFDVQLIGGSVLHEGNIAEMRTGEGKTLVATLPAYLNALAGEGVHVVTVNDYLAQRDANWMRPLYEFLDMSVGIVISGMSPEDKKEAYSADLIYGTNNEFGFDYLRDNMVFSLDEKVQRTLSFAIVDEVDSILVDEARTPLIISGAAADSSEMYKKINTIIPKLKPETEPEKGDGDYAIDEKAKQVELTEQGHSLVEKLLTEIGLLAAGDSLYAASNLMLLHHVHAGLKAHILFHRNVDYLLQNGQVVIVDEHSGRAMPGRRWSEGIHQAIEAKEKTVIQNENQTLASTTFQNYFRMYNKLSGMTGTADTEAVEFHQIYGLDVIVMPTNKPMLRRDEEDLIFLSLEEKYDAIIEDVRECIEKGAPVLVGTATIETSEYLSSLLKKEKIPHQVLNAKFHKKEADIISQAGRPGAITIATNMAGRGTDIVLGGNWEVAAVDASEEERAVLKAEWEETHKQVLAAGGLHIIGTERHESRRIDNQLRGRSGRQGDPGYSRFYLSLEDGLMRIFGSDRVKGLMQSIGMKKGEAIEHRWVSKSIEGAQRKVEGHNFDIRKNVLEYDDVANDQRRVVYSQRHDILTVKELHDSIIAVRHDVVNEFVDGFIAHESMPEQWDISGLEKTLKSEFRLSLPVQQWLDQDDDLHEDGLREKIEAEFAATYTSKEDEIGETTMREFERYLMLQVLDRHWKDHLMHMDHLRQGIHLRGYAQKNPKQEYKSESFNMFQNFLSQVQYEFIKMLVTVELRKPEEIEAFEEKQRAEAKHAAEDHQYQHEGDVVAESSVEAAEQQSTYKRPGEKVGRNEPCPCGSGKKYKQCHGRLNQ